MTRADPSGTAMAENTLCLTDAGWSPAPADAVSMAGVTNGPGMTDDKAKAQSKTGPDVKDSRRDRLKSALRENLKRRKSQARGRDDLAASSEDAAATLDDAGGAKSGQ